MFHAPLIFCPHLQVTWWNYNVGMWNLFCQMDFHVTARWIPQTVDSVQKPYSLEIQLQRCRKWSQRYHRFHSFCRIVFRKQQTRCLGILEWSTEGICYCLPRFEQPLQDLHLSPLSSQIQCLEPWTLLHGCLQVQSQQNLIWRNTIVTLLL